MNYFSLGSRDEYRGLEDHRKTCKRRRSHADCHHEIPFARRIANRVLFLEYGSVVSDTSNEEFFTTVKTTMNG